METGVTLFLEDKFQRGPPVTWKQLPSLALGNEGGRVAGGNSNRRRLQRLLEAAMGCRQGPQNMTENALSILIIFSVQL